MDLFDVVVIVEIWLDYNYQDFEFKFEGYNIFWKDRCNRRGGGVLIVIRNYIFCVYRFDLEVKLEMIVFKIRLNFIICVFFFVFYRLSDIDLGFMVFIT